MNRNMLKHFKNLTFILLAFSAFLFPVKGYANHCKDGNLISPNKKITVGNAGSQFTVFYKNQAVIDFSINEFNPLPRSVNFNKPTKIKEDYNMLIGKRSHCTNQANEYKAVVDDSKTLVIRVYNDGVAFRYVFHGLRNQKCPDEHTAFKIGEGTKRWMMQWTDSYEGFFPLSTTYKVKPLPSFSGISKSPEGWNNRWAFPALIQACDDVFALITEANIERNQSAASLFNDKEIFKVVPDKNDVMVDVEWHTPWRVLVVGSLADVVESTLVTDVCNPAMIQDTGWIKPGVVSWIYWAYNHGSNDLSIIKQYIDMAAKLHLPYMLIDAEWDQMKDGYTVEDALKYANEKGVKPMIWYNSSVGWIQGAPTPKFRLNKPEDREKEFQWCEDHGVAGVKIDFFSGDNQMNMDYCLDLLQSAAKHHLLVNFHGATIPRGWQRTWPNLMSTEAVYGAEWYNNVATFTDKAAQHNATLPFTRNVIGPMDYTPCAFSDSQHPHITSNAHELALTVLFESGLQHLADKPESYFAQPQEVQDFFSQLPAAWDDTKFLGGYPGEYAVIARKAQGKWFVAGVNGTDNNKDIPLNLKNICKGKRKAMLFFDNKSAATGWDIKSVDTSQLPQNISCIPRGGFVIVIDDK